MRLCQQVTCLAALHALCFPRLLVIVCENKLLLYDLNTRKPYEVPRAVLDGKAPSCVAILFRGGRFSPGGQPDPDNLMTSPVLAVGCADGVVRLLHLATLRVRVPEEGMGSRVTATYWHKWDHAFTGELAQMCRRSWQFQGRQVGTTWMDFFVIVPLRGFYWCTAAVAGDWPPSWQPQGWHHLPAHPAFQG
jgi:hypothetical protein